MVPSFVVWQCDPVEFENHRLVGTELTVVQVYGVNECCDLCEEYTNSVTNESCAGFTLDVPDPVTGPALRNCTLYSNLLAKSYQNDVISWVCTNKSAISTGMCLTEYIDLYTSNNKLTQRNKIDLSVSSHRIRILYL